MRIVVDSKETMALLQNLCDIALRQQGIQSLQAITTVLNAIQIEESKAEVAKG